MTQSFTAHVERYPETRLYAETVPGLRGAHTQDATMDELSGDLEEVVSLCLSEYEGDTSDIPRFVGLQQVGIAV